MRKGKILIKPLLVLCAIVCAVIGLLLLNTNKKVTAKAAETDATFSFVPGAALSVEPESAHMRFTVNITQEMYDDLMDPTEVKQVLWWKEYNPDNTYLTIYRCEKGHNGKYLELTSDAAFRFHNDPGRSDMSAEALVFNSENHLQIYLAVPMPSDWTIEYDYFCVLEQFVDADYEHVDGVIYAYRFEERARANNIVTRSVQYIAQAVLDTEVEADPNKYSEEEKTWFKRLAGVTTTEEFFNVNLVYEKLTSYGNIQQVSESYQVDSMFWNSPNMVQSKVLGAKGTKHVSEFNCIYEDESFQKIIREARDYEYVAPETDDGVGTLKVIYKDYTVSDFAIRIQDNNLADNANLYLYHYAGEDEISYDPVLNVGYLTFHYSDIEAKAFSALGWIFEIDENNIPVANSTSTVSIEKTSDYIKLAFMLPNESDLMNVSILINAEIIPDRDITLDINYASLSYANGTIVEEELTSSFVMKFSTYREIGQWYTFEKSEYMNIVSDAVQLDVLNGQYFIPVNVYGVTISEDHFVLNVEYEYRSLLQVFKGKEKPYYVVCDKNSATYTYEDLFLEPSSNDFRLSNLTSEGRFVTISFDESKWKNSSVTLNFLSSEKRIVPIYATYTDKWNLVIEYMQNYKKTPFAEKTISEVQIKVSDYDIEKLTSDDISEILNVNGITMDKVIANVSIPDKKVSTEFTDDSTYTAKVTYGLAAIRQIDYNGNVREIRIPLTSFSDWCSSFGEEWSILFLNSYGKMHFQYSNEVAREDLYGFFSVAVFQERVSDLNYWFRNTTGDGQIVIFENKEVKGSKIYQFFGSLKDNIFTSGLGHVGMFFCELFDKDAGTYHSYFFYLDGSSQNGYISNGGADNAYDTDGALENRVEDFGDWIEDNIVDFFFTILIAIGVACIIIWLLSLLKDFLKKLLK